MKYLLNVNSRTVHDAFSVNRQCRIHLMAEENKMVFDSFQDAMKYLPDGKKPTKPCTFCLGRNYCAK